MTTPQPAVRPTGRGQTSVPLVHRARRWLGHTAATVRDTALWLLFPMPPSREGGPPPPDAEPTRPALPVSDRPTPRPGRDDRAAAQPQLKARQTTRPPRRREPTELQRRLAEAITAGPPGGGTWTPTALAAQIGCARSTARGALQRAAAQRVRQPTRTDPHGTPTRARQDSSTPARPQQRRRQAQQRERV